MSINIINKYNKNIIIDDFTISRDELNSPISTLFVINGYYLGQKVHNLGSYSINELDILMKHIKNIDKLLNKSRINGEHFTYTMVDEHFLDIKVSKDSIEAIPKSNDIPQLLI